VCVCLCVCVEKKEEREEERVHTYKRSIKNNTEFIHRIILVNQIPSSRDSYLPNTRTPYQNTIFRPSLSSSSPQAHVTSSSSPTGKITRRTRKARFIIIAPQHSTQSHCHLSRSLHFCHLCGSRCATVPLAADHQSQHCKG